jgi:hypothetical protein
MKKKSLHHRHLTLIASMLVSTGLAIANEPALAQQTSARWKPSVESIIVRAGALKDWRMALTASHRTRQAHPGRRPPGLRGTRQQISADAISDIGRLFRL